MKEIENLQQQWADILIQFNELEIKTAEIAKALEVRTANIAQTLEISTAEIAKALEAVHKKPVK